MQPGELRRRLDQGEALAVLDVREPDERAYCALRLPPTARDLHIPMGELPGRLDDLRDAALATQVVVYCHMGVRSARVCAWLEAQGIGNAVNLEGGIDAWSVEVDRSVPRY